MASESLTSSGMRKAEGKRISLPPYSSLPVSPSSTPRNTGMADAIPIPISAPRSDFQDTNFSWETGGLNSYKRTLAAPSSWKTKSNFTPSSWGGTPTFLHDDASIYGDGQSDTETVDSSTGHSYARKRRLLRNLSRSSIHSSATPRKPTRPLGPSVKERWTKKLEDFRHYEVGIFKSLLPLKAAVGASLAASLCFAPFVPEILTYYGIVAVFGVGLSLDSNVGLTLEKGFNLMVGSALAGVCAFLVTLVEPFTGSFMPYYLISCTFLGAFLPRLIYLPAIINSRWSQTLTCYISVFHGLILNQSIKMEYTFQLFLNCLCYALGFAIVIVLTLGVKPEYAGDALLFLLVSDFHTAGVVLERIVEDYRSGMVLTKIQELLSGVVTEDHIHHDLQYIMKSTAEAENLIGAVKWEPCHGKFFRGYPWDLYPTLLAMLLHVMYDLISLDSALRAEIQAPLEVRQFFDEDMETVARECSMLFHKVGDSLLEHKKIDYHSNVERARLATSNLRTKLARFSATIIAKDFQNQPPLSHLTRTNSLNSVQENFVEDDRLNAPAPTPPPSPREADRVEELDFERSQKLNIDQEDWQARLFSRRHSISEHWEETQQQISSLSFIKFATVLLELMGRVKILVTMVDQISVEARFSDVS